MSTRGWIGVDLDGTLAHYDRWRGVDHIGTAVPLMVARVLRWLDEGREVKIFTARVHGEEAEEVRVHIWAWCERQGLPRLEITNVKDYAMVELWDDRAIQVVANTGARADGVA